MSTTYAWATDIHLDHIADESKIIKFAEKLVETDPAGVFLTGDISSSKKIVYHLSALERIVQRPIYFVLGNHDYYDGDVQTVRKTMREVCSISEFLKYMPLTHYTMLSKDTAVVGHDGWYDALYADPHRSRFLMSDWVLIRDFVPYSGGGQFMNMMGDVKDRYGLVEAVQKLAHEATTHVMLGIKDAVKRFKNIVVLTHVPPFKESHVYNGVQGDDNAQPWFTSKMMGDMLLDAAKTYPDVSFTILAGHTHGPFDGQIVPNLRVSVGEAHYGNPAPQRLITVP